MTNRLKIFEIAIGELIHDIGKFIFCGREDPFHKGGDVSPQVH